MTGAGGLTVREGGPLDLAQESGDTRAERGCGRRATGHDAGGEPRRSG